MPRSMLVYQEVPEAGPGPTVIGLHGGGGDLDQLLPLAGAIGPVRLVAPQAVRPVTPATQGTSGSPGGFTWFFIQELGYPEPATFGEGLWMVEQFVYDVRDRGGANEPTFLLGFDQGGVLSATLAAVLPDTLTGVVSISGYLPHIPGWSPPVEDLKGFPVLLVRDQSESQAARSLAEETARELARRHAAVDEQHVAGVSHNPALAADLVRAWLEAQPRSEGVLGA
jgi:phospholipase/carboxylesterase